MKGDSMIEEMYGRYAKPVKWYLISLCGNNDIADDITSEVFLKAIKNIDRFKGGNMLAWLCTIGKNTYFDHIRKKENTNVNISSHLAQTVEDTAPSPEETIIEKDTRLMLYRALQSIDPEYREVIYLKLFAGLTFKEIGVILGKSENWTRVVFYRSKNKLKGLIDNEK